MSGFNTVYDRSTSDRLPRVGFRHPTSGPENTLVDWLLEAMPFTALPGYKATIFREPQVKSAFPDLIIAWWKAGKATKRSKSLTELSHDELRLLHFFATQSGKSVAVEEMNVLNIRRRATSLRLLSERGFIRSTRMGLWRLASKLDDMFAVKKIVTVEAKMHANERLFEQAIGNTWFSCESYVVLPRAPSVSMIERAKHLGLGVITQEDGRLLKPLRAGGRSSRQKSYGAWLINQWVVASANNNRKT